MKITRTLDALKRTVFHAELSEYDAEPPVRDWILDDLPLKINPELEAIALYLIFGPWCGGEFVVPNEMGPNTAAAISRDARHDFFCSPIEFYPKALPKGSGTLIASEKSGDLAPGTVISLNSDDWNGSIRSTSCAAIANNGSLFASGSNDLRPTLALGTLMADELGASRILIKSDFPGWDRYQSLLREVGLEFRVVEKSQVEQLVEKNLDKPLPVHEELNRGLDIQLES